MRMQFSKMAMYICFNCGTIIRKSALNDPYMCKDCEKLIEGAEDIERYLHLDNY